MGKFSGYLFCSDIDGTIVGQDGKISSENEEAIRYFQENGGLFTLATGRWFDYIHKFKPGFTPNTHVICLNGTVLCHKDTGDIIVSRPFHKTDATADNIKRILTEFPEICAIDVFLDSGNDGMSISAEELLATDMAELRKIAEEQTIYKMLLIHSTIDTSRVDSMNEKFGDKYVFGRSWPEGTEVVSYDSGKGAMIDILREMADTHIHTTIAVGDYENDIQMVKHADIGYAVLNAADALKKVADKITVHHNDSAIAKIIADLD